MALNFLTAFKDILVDLFAAYIEDGTLKVYTGDSPGPSVAATGTLLVTLTVGANINASSGGTAALNVTVSGTAVADGTAGYVRFQDSGSNVIDGSVGVTGSGEDFEFSSLQLWNGYDVNMTVLNLVFA